MFIDYRYIVAQVCLSHVLYMEDALVFIRVQYTENSDTDSKTNLK